jgi:hypothetical protein
MWKGKTVEQPTHLIMLHVGVRALESIRSRSAENSRAGFKDINDQMGTGPLHF